MFLIKEDVLENNFISICRATYLKTIQDINRLFEEDKNRSKLPLQLIYQ